MDQALNTRSMSLCQIRTRLTLHQTEKTGY